MDEDFELNRFVKAALEAAAPFECRHGRRARSRVRWAVPSLLAASVAIVAAFTLPFSTPRAPVSDVICLLSESEDLSLAANRPTASDELLLAWQDAALDE